MRTAAFLCWLMTFACTFGTRAENAPPRGAARIAVVSQDGNVVTEIDLGTDRVVATHALDKGPAGIAASPDGQWLYLTHPDGAAISIVDARGQTAPRHLSFAGEPFGIAAGTDALYVSDWMKGLLTRLDLVSGQTLVVMVGRSPAGLVLDPTRHRVYVADRDGGTVTVVHAKEMIKLATIPTGTAPFALALAPDGRRLFVANVQSADLAVIDTDTLTRTATIDVGAMPYGVAVTPDGASVLVTNQHANTIAIVDVRSLKRIATVAVGRYPEGVVVGQNGRAYVANWFSNDISVVDLQSRREIRRIAVADGPRNLALLPDRSP